MSRAVDERILAYLADEIDEADLRALESDLRGDPTAARRFARLCRGEAALAKLMRASSRARPASVARARAPRARILAGPWLAAAAVVVLGLGLLALLEARGGAPAVATIAELGGSASVSRGGAEVPLAAGAALLPGDRIAVGAGSRLGLALDDGTAIALGADAELELPRPDRPGNAARRFTLARGAASARVARQAPGAPLIVATPQGRAEVVGTRLRLAVDDRSTRLEVDEGRVRFTRGADGASLLVDAGRAATATADAAFAMAVEQLAPLSARLTAGARLLLRMDAAHADGWEGEAGRPVDARAGPLAIGAVRPQPGTRFSGEIRSGVLAGATAGDHAYLGFRYFAEGFRAGDLIKLMVKGADGANYHGFIATEPGGWREAVARLDGAFVHLEGRSEPLPAGAITGLVFLGAAPDGRSAAPGARLWLAEVVVFTAPGPVATVAVEQR